MATMLADRVGGVDETLPDWLERRLGTRNALLRLERERRLERDRAEWGWRKRTFSKTAIIELWAPLAVRVSGLLAHGRRNTARITVVRNEVVLPRLPEAFDGFTILHLSDLHADISRQAMRALPDILRDLDYDLCVITGDFRGEAYGPHRAAVDMVSGLIPNIVSPILGVPGNHDPAALLPELEKLGVRMLMNESCRLTRGGDRLWIVGVDDPHFYRTHDLETAMRDVTDGDCAILLAHSTDQHQEAQASGADLMLSGHTHGGQICLPGGIPVLTSCRQPRAMAAGPWRYGNMPGYTSRGVGTSAVEARFNCRPEVILHKLVRSPAKA